MIKNKPVFLGLRLCEHDTNIALSIGSKVKYRKTERNTQIKHHSHSNLWEWLFVLEEWNINVSDIDAIGLVIDDKNYDCISVNDYDAPYEILNHQYPHWQQIKCPIYRIDHHYAHVMSCWPMGIESTTDFVFDGFGDDERSHTIYKNKKQTHYAKLSEAESIGRYFGTIGEHVGMNGYHLDHAGKLMGLKSYGNFDLDFYKQISHFGMYDIAELLNIQKWYAYKGSKNLVECEWVNWLRTVHDHLEKIYPNYFLEHCNPNEVVTYTGGIAQNTCINTKIKKVIPNLHIPPHNYDGGLSLGCIEVLRQIHDADPFDTSGFPFWQDDQHPGSVASTKTIKQTAERLAKGDIVGWYQGHGEIGPRALGNRSVLMNPNVENGKDIINSKVKFREPYRPFGASVLLDHVNDYFDWDEPSPYMLYVQKVRDPKAFAPITHVDNTCRIQTVGNENPLYSELIEEFRKLTGIPMLLNTSLNVNTKPIAGYKSNCWDIFHKTAIDSIVIGDYTLQK